MHRHPNKVAPQICQEGRAGGQQGEDWVSDGKGASHQHRMKQQSDSCPVCSSFAMFIITIIEFFTPGIIGLSKRFAAMERKLCNVGTSPFD